MVQKIIIGLCISFGLTSSLFSYIYETQVFRIWDKDKKQYQYVIGLSDYHDKVHPINKTQRQYIERALQHAPAHTLQFIVEDLSSSGAHGVQSCGNYIINSQEGILAGLAQFARNAGVVTDNVEYRYCRVASLGPLVMHPHKAPHDFQSARSMKIGSLLDEVRTNVTVSSASGDPQLKKLCDTEISAVYTALDKLNLTAHKGRSVADFLMQIPTPERRLSVVKELLIFDSALLDIKIMHAIAKSDFPVIVVCAGGSHIARTGQMLKKMGYTHVARTPVRYYKEYDTKKCTATTITRGSCVKPHPVSLDSLDQYLPH